MGERKDSKRRKEMERSSSQSKGALSKGGIRLQHPASFWNQIRHHAYSIFEKTNDMNKALSAIFKYSLPPELQRKFLAGLRAELTYYSRERANMKLEPLLDAGVKADFTGIRDGEPVNIDVTTNLGYKDINRYAEATRTRGKLYEIALVDIKQNRVESFPLKFPLCPGCGRFSYHVLFLNAPEGGSQWWASDYQELLRHCPHCWSFDKMDSYAYLVPSPLLGLKEEKGYQSMPETRDSTFEPTRFLEEKCIPIARFFEKTSRVLLSAVAEMDYLITNPQDGDGDWSGRVLWNHPLARDIPELLDLPF